MGSKHSLLMKFDQFMSYYKKKIVQKFYKILQVPGPFVFTKNLAQPPLENEIFEASYLYSICISKTIKNCPNHQTDFLRFFLQMII